MAFDIALKFSGSAREAGEYYSKVFQTPVEGLKTYGEIPDGKIVELGADVQHYVLYSDIRVMDTTIMMWDDFLESNIDTGNRISLSLSYREEAEARKVFEALSEQGQVENELEETFFARLYGEVVDRYGIQWIIVWEQE